ncbi:MAG: SAM-dependent methyltransferase [Verrucomicrobiota bacterium]
MGLRAFLNQFFEENGGSMPFEQFMAAALYHPEHGYYAKNIANVGGERADFSTWATLFPLANPIAAWIKEEILHHSWRSPIHLIEIGAGDGSLAKGILQELGWGLRKKVKYHIVDVSAPLREQQRKTLGRKAQWHFDLAAALAAAEGRALIFSNELVDAFPPRWLEWQGQWSEVHVAYDEASGLQEKLVPTSLDYPLDNPKMGQRVELHQSYQAWLAEWAPLWKQGSLLTIDYGAATTAEVYDRRVNGTLRGYYRQNRIEGSAIYARFGKQDLTADIDFHQIRGWGENHGWATDFLIDQAAFFDRFLGSCPDPESAAAFQVLSQRCS